MFDVRNVFIVPGDGDAQVTRMFTNEGWGIVDDLNDADLVQFVGGADVNPELYGHHKHPTTYYDAERDDREMSIYLDALEQGIPMAGICRGGQFLNVMNGGTLFQDVDNHGLATTHKAWLVGAILPIDVTSTHHQMMCPNYSASYLLVMAAHQSKRKHSMSKTTTESFETIHHPPLDNPTDVEALFYRDTNCFCFQPHPEYSGPYCSETREVYFELLDRYLFSDAIDENLRDEA
jgi:gamma-glutamyl-gamma-aminobutyrate hydrolase PuuD